MKKTIIFLIISIMLPLIVNAQFNRRPTITLENSDFGFINPVITGMAPDPSICRVGDDFYLVNSSFLQYPGLPLYHSRDLINWELINYCCTEEQGLDLSRGNGLFAPTIRYSETDETFYVVCTNMGNGGNFITYTKDPFGKWSNLIPINISGIDPSLFFDTDGKCYFTGTGIKQAEINPKTGEILSEVKTIWTGTGGRSPEGPHLYKINNIYYLMISEGGTEIWHEITIARSNSPWGPWEVCPDNPILCNLPKVATNEILATGHADLVQAGDGSWWMVFLATRPQNHFFANLARETFLAPVQWSVNNWPIVNSNGTASIQNLVRTLKQTEDRGTDFNCDFNKDVLPLEFNYYRNPVWDNYSITNGQLILKGTDDRSTFIGIRQKDFDCTAETVVDFSPKSSNEEAGICIRNDINRGHYDIGVTLINGKRHVICRFRFGTLVDEVVSVEIPIKGKVYLRTNATRAAYDMQYSLDGKKWISLGSMDTDFLAGGFSGILIGLYQYGEGTNSSQFDYFKYTGRD